MQSLVKTLSTLAFAALTCLSPIAAQDSPPFPPETPAPDPAGIVEVSADVEAAESARDHLEEASSRIQIEVQKSERSIASLNASEASEARRELAQAQVQRDRQLAQVGRAIELAQAAPPPPDGIPGAPRPVVRQRLNAIVSRGPSRALVLRFDQSDPAGPANLEEDLTVMSRVLERSLVQSLGDEDGPKASGIQVLFAPDGGSARNVYLEGYGALFMMNVRFPLLAPEKKAEEPKPKEAVDSTWEDAKRDLYGERDPWNISQKFRFEYHGAEPQQYDAGKVEKLRKSLLEGLKSASNIRGLKPEDWISVVVFGGSASAGRVEAVKPGTRADGRGTRKVRDERGNEDVVVIEESPVRPRSGTVLALRVKKSDADEFAKGRIDADQFARKVSLTTYAADTGGWGADNRLF